MVTAEAPTRATWRALGTTALVDVRDPEALSAAVTAVREELELVDRVASRFRDDSELSALNRADGRRTAVSARLHDLLALALEAARCSGGAVDPTLGARLIELGYDRDIDALTPAPADAPLPDAPAAGGDRLRVRRTPAWHGIRLADEPPAVEVPAGVSLDLGATAKAAAADRAAEAAYAATGGGVLVSLGGDIATRGPAPDGGWVVRVTDDHRDPGPDGQLVTIGAGGLATSSVLVRRWLQDGEPRHHILDPRTGQPARGRWRTATVMAATCAGANVASTASIVLGEDAEAWLARYGVPARLVAAGGEVVTLGGWPR